MVGSWEEQPNIWLTVAKNTFDGRALSFTVRMLLKRRSKFSKQDIQSSIGKYRKIHTKAKILRLGLTSNDKILEVTEIGFDWMINQLVDHSLEIKA